MKVRNPFGNFTRFEWSLWIGSMLMVILSFGLGGEKDPLTLVASLVGVTALIFVAKGAILGQILTTLFSIIYAIISLKFHYYGEMITYVGMTMPIAMLSIISWAKHPYEGGKGEVKVSKLSKQMMKVVMLLTVIVTLVFYFILQYFGTANLAFSTLSIATSFMASFLMFLRSPYYAVAYAGNDVVLIILWLLASMENSSYFPMIICFAIFLVNDVYGFINWQRMKEKQIAE